MFGAGGELDGYVVALGLLAGAMAKAAVPVLSRQATGDDGARRSDPGDPLLAGEIVAVLAPGFSPAEAASAEHLTRVVLIAAAGRARLPARQPRRRRRRADRGRAALVRPRCWRWAGAR
ncbi:hypothetical protein [Jiangella asiatica]|uniref:Uncharacterized protein n=1 Tax=Jiangella asiatica TaxID=2530372 RepID=A0A4R5DCL0_9ACTN|nr:hypothetical protein [Jiangella asiatica]TDE11486.1 hypothetical protein E1269_09495 [Jiangella asiatica]